MKWCMVAAMAVSLLFSGMAWAQEDDFDLDALLGDVGTEEVTEAEPVAEEAAVEETVAVEAPAEEIIVSNSFAEEMAAENAVEEADVDAEAAEGAAVEAADAAEELDALESVEDVDPFAESDAAPEETAPAEETVEDSVVEETAEADPFAADVTTEETAPAEEAVEEAGAAADGDILSDLFAEDEPEEAAGPVEEAVGFEELTAVEEPAEDVSADFDALDMEEDVSDNGITTAEPKRSKKSSDEEQISSRELKKLAKEQAKLEEVRRQAAEADALKSSEAGFKALEAKEYVDAETAFAAALQSLPDRPQNVDVRTQIAWGLAEAQYQRARGMVQKKERLAEARKLVDSALEAAPDHRGAQALDKRLTKLEYAESLPKEPADRPETIAKQKSIQEEFDEARQWYHLKDYDRATALFENILQRDPYHKSSMRFLRKIEADKYKLATYEREARAQEMMTDVRRSWSPPIRAEIELPKDVAKGEGVDSKPASERLNEKMQEIIIPAVEFRQANINDVVNFLVEASIAADPEKEGVNIILNLGQSGGGGSAAPAPAPDTSGDDWGFGEDFGAPLPDLGSGGGGNIRDITLNLRRISMLDAIKYITEVAGLKYRIEDSAVIITPIDAPIGKIITRMYPVQPSFMDVIVERQTASDEDRGDAEFTSMGGRVSVTKSDVKDFFEKTGVKFPTGASITYNAAISQLIVANTADNLETFERILQQLNVVPNQVEIEARFIEVAQDDLEELGLQWILNDNYEFATASDGSGERMQINANNNGLTQGLRFFSYNSGNLNVEPASVLTQTANQTMLGGILSASSVLTNPEMTVVIQALSQHGGTDLLSAPRVTTRSGVNAQIQVVKEIIYPTEFEVTQPTMNTDGNVTMSPVVTPGTFTTRETGVILNVTPTVGPDGYTIDLVMAPEVAELVDWIQYGSEITVTTGIVGARQENTYLFNMPQPVFTSRNVTTSIVIWDGQTVVMGGLIREELTTIKDKVPILGDIPLLGWLFRSEGQYSQKMNLLIFVTARLVDPAGRPIHNEATMAMPGAGIDTGAPATASAAAP